MLLNKNRRLVWDIFILGAILFSAFEMPFSLVFTSKSSFFLYANFFVDIVFLLDLSLNVYEGIKSPKNSPEREYFHFWFWVDFPAAFPAVILSFFFYGFGNLTYLSLIKVIRIFRVAKIFQTWGKIGKIKPNRIGYQRIIIFILFTSIVSHWVSLGWIYVGGVEKTSSIVSTYINAMYWTITTFTTIGYGDITPKNDEQKLFTMLIMVIGAGLYGYIIGNITSLLSNMDHAKLSFTARMEKIASFLKFKKIPIELQEDVYNYYGYLWETHKGYDELNIMKDLPFSLRMKLSLYMNKGIIEKIPIFKNANEEIIQGIVLQLKPVIFTPGDFIFRVGEEGSDMYFISHGSVEILDETKSIVYATMGEGGYFGEMALLFSDKRSASARAIEYCDLYKLDRVHFLEVIHKFPEFAEEITKVAKERRRSH